LSLSPENLEATARLIVQDYRGRMKPLDTLARETSIKITRRTRFEGREPVGFFLGLGVHPEAWYQHPMIHVKNPGVRQLLGVDRSVRHVALSSVLQDDGYTLREVVEAAHRTPANRRDKTQQKLVVFDERVHLLFGALQGTSLRIFPVPDDPGNTWQTIEKVLEGLPERDPRREEFTLAAGTFFGGLLAGDDGGIGEGLRLIHELQRRYGAEVIPSKMRIDAELALNQTRPFVVSTVPYLTGFVLLIVGFFVGLLSRRGGFWSWKSPIYLLGMSAFVAGFGIHLWGFVLRWIASARAPLSNGHESLLWVALAVALAGILFELVSRTAAVGAVASLLSAVVLGVSMLGTFDPSIGPLMPVLASYWLNIHVTVITASYGFLGLCSLLGLLTLVLVLIHRRRSNPAAVRAIDHLDQLNVDVMIVGVGLLTVGTLLGGVWANESWGRYWGWDPKETWALVSILLYAMILHFRWIPRLANPFVQAAGSFLAIWSIVMTYFGVNYLLMGMHSYAAGDTVAIPLWVTLSGVGSVLFTLVAWLAWSSQREPWTRNPASR
jgi:cytochrome c-type biogenesis protein CcsB